MKIVIDTIFYHVDENGHKIEIQWGEIHKDGVKHYLTTETYEWSNHPHILDSSQLQKMKPGCYNKEENEPVNHNLFLSHAAHAARLRTLKYNRLEIIIAQIPHIFYGKKKLPYARLKAPVPSTEFNKDELRVLYPLAYVVYHQKLLSDGITPCCVPVYLLCEKGTVKPQPEESMYKAFKPPHSLRIFGLLHHSQPQSSPTIQEPSVTDNDWKCSDRDDSVFPSTFTLFGKTGEKHILQEIEEDEKAKRIMENDLFDKPPGL